MIKQITLSNFKLIPKEKPGKLPDHNLLISFVPKTTEDLSFSTVPMDIKGPYMNGVVDYSINDKDFDCTLFYEDSLPTNMRDTARYFMYFTPKMKKDGGMDSDTVEPAKPAQLVDSSNAKTDYKSIRSYPDGKSKVLISDEAIAFKVAGEGEEGQAMIISPSQISIFGKMVKYGFPEDNHIILEESGVMAMLPKAFVPPFCTPSFLPNPTMVIKTVEALNVVKKLKGLLG